MYAQGVAVEQDNATALEYFRRGAAKDHPPSQNGLGYMYMHGYGVTKDFKRAIEYFKAAAERGNAEAQFNLGAMYIGGMGVPKGHDKALHYFTLSAHQGHTLALYNLGQMHLNGLGCAPRLHHVDAAHAPAPRRHQRTRRACTSRAGTSAHREPAPVPSAAPRRAAPPAADGR